MNIRYTSDKNIDAKTLLAFFTAAGNPDAQYQEKLVAAIHNSDTVVSAWDKDTNELAALITAIDDGLCAYIRYLVVAPPFRGKGINDELIAQVKTKYADYPYLYNFAADDFHASFFTKLGFKIQDGAKVLTK